MPPYVNYQYNVATNNIGSWQIIPAFAGTITGNGTLNGNENWAKVQWYPYVHNEKNYSDLLFSTIVDFILLSNQKRCCLVFWG